ncbi:MAG: molybdopterin-guanine dinucleotide biosynthesis MobA [Halieaceae bacterium MED-G27]|jgi:molybdenum cofactor cytidylyltransferase|nr:MAG: molybdopterin-guanine dinucleotide biosynthesis MobA [Halieaceae bacterium MED-G27]|tara:strand:- start:6281 stop:6862 length:582 start_codon:yes stop_codon:yes gene_type:complete
MTGDEPRLAVLIMAAGESRRFGSCKLLANIDGKPMLQRSIELAQSTDASLIRVVTGRWHQEVKQAQTSGLIDDIDLIYNSDWQQGLGNSIATGISQVASLCDEALVLLADQVRVSGEDLKRLTLRDDKNQIACASYSKTLGPPAIFPAQFFPELEKLSGDKGAKALLAELTATHCQIDIPSASLDVDVLSDLT